MDHWIPGLIVITLDIPVKCALVVLPLLIGLYVEFSVLCSVLDKKGIFTISFGIIYQDSLSSPLTHLWSALVILPSLIGFYVGFSVFCSIPDKKLYFYCKLWNYIAGLITIPMTYLWSALVISLLLVGFYVGFSVFALFLTRKDFCC